mgnify:CR=1 FL=1
MKIYLGKEGLNKSWQEEFPESIKCYKCRGNCRIMFVGFEGDKKEKFVCELYNNMEDEKYWPHDCIAIACYLCEKCFEPNTLMNQA